MSQLEIATDKWNNEYSVPVTKAVMVHMQQLPSKTKHSAAFQFLTDQHFAASRLVTNTAKNNSHEKKY